MEMYLRLRMLSDENDYFLRDYDISYEMSLLDLHNFICADLRYDAANMASFFLSDGNWERLREFTLIDVGVEGDDMPQPMSEATVGQILHHNGDRLIWLFDVFANRAYYLELTGAYKSESSDKLPRVNTSEGIAPDQFNAAMNVGDGSIFDDIMDEFNDFEGDDAYDDE